MGESALKTRIHVNQHELRRNRKDGGNRPVITAKNYKENQYGHEVHLEGPSKVIYRPNNPLPCGAVLWIETDSGIKVL